MILVTGGAGFIGSHLCAELLAEGHDVTVLDSLVTGHAETTDRVRRITGRAPTLIVGDVRDRLLLKQLLRNGCTAVLHLAGLKAVGASVRDPASYYDANVAGAASLLSAMHASNVRKLIFSSSATVYGTPQHLPIKEEHPRDPVNPYGRSKFMIEEILRDLALSDDAWSICALRYFNPIGAHESGLIGEDPSGTPGNLMPLVLQTAIGQRSHVRVFGNDYPTPDGTGVRDYLHVCDLARGHVEAVNRLEPGFSAYNLGRGEGASVLDVIAAVRSVSGCRVSYRVEARRPGDVATYVADPRVAAEKLNWRAERDLRTAARDAWRWQMTNPDGYGPPSHRLSAS